MSKFSRKQIVRHPKQLSSLTALRFHPKCELGDINQQRYFKLMESINIARTPQGSSYWRKRYYWFAHMDIPGGNCLYLAEEMTDEDWDFLEYLQKDPIDGFLTEKENEEYVQYAVDIAKKV